MSIGFKHALRGIIICVKEANFVLQIAIATITIGSGFYFGLSTPEWLIIIICIGMVLGAEAMNTAIEKMCNLITIDYNSEVKDIKDIAAGGVLLISLSALIVGIKVFIPYLLN